MSKKVTYPNKIQGIINKKKRERRRKNLLGLVMAVGIMVIARKTIEEA